MCLSCIALSSEWLCLIVFALGPFLCGDGYFSKFNVMRTTNAAAACHLTHMNSALHPTTFMSSICTLTLIVLCYLLVVSLVFDIDFCYILCGVAIVMHPLHHCWECKLCFLHWNPYFFVIHCTIECIYCCVGHILAFWH